MYKSNKHINLQNTGKVGGVNKMGYSDLIIRTTHLRKGLNKLREISKKSLLQRQTFYLRSGLNGN
jgi:hypothetical protein